MLREEKDEDMMTHQPPDGFYLIVPPIHPYHTFPLRLVYYLLTVGGVWVGNRWSSFPNSEEETQHKSNKIMMDSEGKRQR